MEFTEFAVESRQSRASMLRPDGETNLSRAGYSAVRSLRARPLGGRKHHMGSDRQIPIHEELLLTVILSSGGLLGLETT